MLSGVFGHGEWGTCTERSRSIGHGEEITNALCPMPQAAGRLSLSTPLALWSFPPLSMNAFPCKADERGNEANILVKLLITFIYRFKKQEYLLLFGCKP
ncbi:hypothetical protein [Nostoc sp. CHAB 5715]|uniref:hypothetical protein n=1 Tax=Nostoc sp. CHAB 5715 TaxID=2780400 RepID=UPI001E644AD0|nr:hypothetical protein [Nostoc sp. CHAB 5715]MCC5620924.1 hypothetical protein [Nostoc sp. CHAB 5715]